MPHGNDHGGGQSNATGWPNTTKHHDGGHKVPEPHAHGGAHTTGNMSGGVGKQGNHLGGNQGGRMMYHVPA
ncbi:hypothetical protein SPRG_09991 [Saprolegnia parasitica CBS 223.65]|uniref:Uncharacterized protein n=1 Tax=Saprolegnia parasitica (strain CBS 223.65) TaxID=695850 RepID=A0A067BY70_SAPPC|nr:hypothetical protein SPRG_09991 [Saprolegnia parasitica CBS 223.65]KDO23183.1 hypothetical protein SPRG_09991 [Saprolegnia parasitica CBS 223.65]|eukprot:XP_012206135.1 hypothetical protein SPRG_09991 [Saprolegnia parasitica CBS 223.65]